MSECEQAIQSLVAKGILRIDADGTVWRCGTLTRTGRLRMIDPSRADTQRPDGYRRIRASVNGREITAAAHRIVWMAKNGPIPEGKEVNHLDGDRGNNRPGNLEVVTKSENLQHAYDVLDRWRPSGERCHHHKLTPEQVAEIRRRSVAGEGQRALGRAFGVTHRSIRLIITGQSWRDEYPAVAS